MKHDLKKILSAASEKYLDPSQKESIIKLLQSGNPINDLSSVPVVDSQFFLQQSFIEFIGKAPPTNLITSSSDSNTIKFRPTGDDVFFEKTIELFREANIDFKSTLVLNAYPAGISLPPKIKALDVGSRLRTLHSALSHFSHQFKNIIMIIQPYLLKQYFDLMGVSPSIKYDHIVFSLGGEWFPKSYIVYLSRKLKIQQDIISQRLFSFYGCAEVGLGMGIMTPTENLERDALPSPSPMIFKANLMDYYFQESSGGLCVTNINDNRAWQMINYLIGDNVVVNHNKLYHSGRLSLSSKTYELIEEIYRNEEMSQDLTSQFWKEDGKVVFEAYRPISKDCKRILVEIVENEIKVVIRPENFIDVFNLSKKARQEC